MAEKTRNLNGGNDKYYTRPFIARFLTQLVVDTLNPQPNTTFVEPSAGSGVFVDIIETMKYKIKSFDIEPHDSRIQKKDWFDVDLDSIKNNIVVGNPPFGMKSSLAIRFFNHAAKNQAQSICFILPKTFKKQSIENQLDCNYVKKIEFDLPYNSFYIGDEKNHYDVPSVFQIWARVKKPRQKIQMVTTSKYFEFVDTIEEADYAIRRVGGRAGKMIKKQGSSKSTTFYIRTTNKYFVVALKLMDETKYVDNTAGVRSISKHELITEVDGIIDILMSN